MIVVVDTNVVVSAFHFTANRGSPLLAIERVAAADRIATCDEIDSEIIRILVQKFRWPVERAEHRLALLMEEAIRVPIANTLHLCRDPGDDKFLECAHRARAHLLITGDKDLLSLRTHGRTRILTPAAYLKR